MGCTCSLLPVPLHHVHPITLTFHPTGTMFEMGIRLSLPAKHSRHFLSHFKKNPKEILNIWKALLAQAPASPGSVRPLLLLTIPQVHGLSIPTHELYPWDSPPRTKALYSPSGLSSMSAWKPSGPTPTPVCSLHFLALFFCGSSASRSQHKIHPLTRASSVYYYYLPTNKDKRFGFNPWNRRGFEEGKQQQVHYLRKSVWEICE